MSTNFYLRNKKEYKKCQKANAIIEDQIKEIINQIKTIIDEEYEVNEIKWKLEDAAYVECDEIHIGKRSMGWKPAFERQEYFSSVKELREFCLNNQDKYEIVDEYGDVYDWSELQKELINWNPEGRENMMTGSYKDDDGYIWHTVCFS